MALSDDLKRANEETRQAWDQNAAFWDARMGEGNDFVELLVWPATERLLQLQPGERVLDVACGNGLTSRRLSALGAQVVAFDFKDAVGLSPALAGLVPDRLGGGLCGGWAGGESLSARPSGRPPGAILERAF